MFDVNTIFEERCKVEKMMEYRKWCNEIPYIPFPSSWHIKIIPPFGGAVVRFSVKTDDIKNSVSVYLDCYDALGCVGQPYWEVYPHDGDCFRCYMAETDKLIGAIGDSLTEIKNNETEMDKLKCI